ncbi:MAG: xerC 1 [Gammaproteobacteria bacterium]|jgi:integrase|nr:xerC 1 [Gammaproteobacteria bacterium]
MAIKFEKLTRNNLRKLSTGEKLEEHGITFERLKNGDGKFTINIMVDGQRIHRVVGKESEGVTRQQAEDLISSFRTDARHGRLNLPKGRKTVFSFKEAAEKYLERQSTEGAKNLKPKRTHLIFHLIPFFKDMPLNAVSTSDVERYKKFRSEQFVIPKEKKNSDKTENKKEPRLVKPSTINRELSTLSHLLTQAVEWGWIDKSQAKIKKFKEEQTRITYLTIEQINRLYEAAKKDENPQVYPFTVIGIGTSMRKMEILSIRVADLDLDKLFIYLPKAKAGARQQPITKQAAECLQEYLKTLEPTEEWLFPSAKSETGHTVNIDKAFRRIVQAAGMNANEVVRHTLRHTAITHLVQAGVDLPTVKRISGHKTLQMVERYSHQNGAHIQAAMDKLEERYNTITQK